MSTMNNRAFLRGEQRSPRYRYRHTPLGAAVEVGLPEEWVWLWVKTGLLKYRTWLKKVWVRLEDVVALLDGRKWFWRLTPSLALEGEEVELHRFC